MLRLAAVALLFAVFAQTNMADADVAMEGRSAAILQETITSVLEAAPGNCCHKTEAVSERPSACKSDCKIVMAAASPVPPEALPYHSRPYPKAATLYKAPVDLRPPIS